MPTKGFELGIVSSSLNNGKDYARRHYCGPCQVFSALEPQALASLIRRVLSLLSQRCRLENGHSCGRESGRRNGLLMMGAGVLRRLTAHNWRNRNPDATAIVGTRTVGRHHELSLVVIQAIFAESTDPVPPYVVFCIPPSGAKYYADYCATRARAVER